MPQPWPSIMLAGIGLLWLMVARAMAMTGPRRDEHASTATVAIIIAAAAGVLFTLAWQAAGL